MRYLLALFIVCFSMVAVAAADSGVYIAGRAGASFMQFNDGKWTNDLVGDITYNYNRNVSEAVFVVGGAIGYDFENPFRTELEYTYRTNFENNKRPTTDGNHNVDMDLTAHAILLNAFYDFENSTDFTPFVMIGGGMSVLCSDNNVEPIGAAADYDERQITRTNFAWALGTGAGYSLNDDLTLDLLVRYVDLGEARWENYDPGTDEANAVAQMTAIECVLGLRYEF